MRGLVSLGVFLLLAAAPPAGVVASRTADREAVPLSGSVAVTLVLEGPAPLRITPPKGWLAAESEAVWSVRPAGPVAVAAAPGGRERWALPLRLDPFVPGDAVVVQFATVEVRAGAETEPRTLGWDALSFKVSTSLKDAKADDARPITGVEDPPAPPPADAAFPADRVAALGLVLAAGLALVIARRRRAVVVPPSVWAAGELDRLEREALPPAVVLDRLAGVLRRYLERTSGVPATRLTTAELLARPGPAADDAGWRDVLERCDAAKFAGDVPTADEARRLVGVARRLVGGTDAAP